MTRRALLGVVAVTLVACGKKRNPGTPPTTPPPVPPDTAALTDARKGEEELIAWYDKAIARASLRHRPALQVERAIHVTHRAALRSTPADAVGLPIIANLRQALRTSARRLRRHALAATDGNNAALLASIAASHEVSAT